MGGTLWTIAGLAMGLAGLVATLARGKLRAFGLGFAALGLLYLLVWQATPLGGHLPTTTTFEAMRERAQGPPPDWKAGDYQNGDDEIYEYNCRQYLLVAHAFACLSLAMMGGVALALIARRPTKPPGEFEI